MAHLSATASIVLEYALAHQCDGFAEIGEDIRLPENVVITACKELKSNGKILDFETSNDSVEFIKLNI
jgi:hypothetical protein